MKQFLVVAGLAAFALIAMDAGQIVPGPAGFALNSGQAMAADLGQPYEKAPPPPPAPVGKGKAPIIGKGKEKAPVVTTRD